MEAAAGSQPGPDDELPFRFLAERLATPCWISDAEGAIIWVNGAWVGFTGLDVAGIAAAGLRSLHDPDVYPEVVRVWEETKARGAPNEMVFPLRGKDGRFRRFHTRVVPITDSAGVIRRWFGTNTDITELATSREEWREVFEAAADGIFLADANDRFIDVNPAGCELVGYTREELLTLTNADLVAPDDVPRARSVGERAAQAQIAGDWRLKRKDGSFADVSISARVLSDGRRLAIVHDITERKRRQDELAASAAAASERAAAAERQLQRFWDASKDLFAIASRLDGRPTSINAAAWEETLGYSSDEIMGRRLMELVHPDDRARIQGLDAEFVAAGAVFGLENRYRHKDGRWVWLSWNIVREGPLSYCIARNVTEERARAESAARNQRLEALGQLTGGVAHDFNNLLTTILGSLDLMQRRPNDIQLRDRLMMAALGAVRRGEQLNKQLLSFSRGHPAGAVSVDVRVLLADMRPLLESALGGQIALAIEAAPDVTGCRIDASQLEAALLNLVVNARDAMPEGGALTIRTRAAAPTDPDLAEAASGDYAVIEVTDTGVGMSPDVRAHVFEPFFTTKDIGQGAGLGLAQVYGAVRQAGGAVALETEEGHGTTVRIYLPRSRLPEETAGPVRAWDPTGERVLLVEDDPLVGIVTETLLQDLGYEVARHANAVEALKAVRAGGYDILLTDVRMPGGLSGLDLAKAAKASHPNIKVLLASGWMKSGAEPAPPWPLLQKPFDGPALQAALSAL